MEATGFVLIGAGPSGLAVGACLQQRRVDFTILRKNAKAPPTNKYQTTTGFQRLTDVGKRSHRIAEKHHAEAGESCVETSMPEIVRLGVK